MSISDNEVWDFAERAWNGELTDEERRASPLLLFNGGIVEIKDDIYFYIGFGNVTIVDTYDGIVLIDSGHQKMGDMVYQIIREKFKKKWIIACIYTHGHIDHVGGIIDIQHSQKRDGGPDIKIYGHSSVGKRLDRYKETCGYNAHINSIQFTAGKNSIDSNYNHFIHPSITYEDQLDVEIGGTKFNLNHDKGETDDATWVYIEDQKILCTGDFFIWNMPNCGNPQQTQRYPEEWAIALKKMLYKDIECLLPGHGPMICGKDRVKQALTDTSSFLQDIYNQTIQLMNHGYTLNQIISEVKLNEKLINKPYLRPFYDDPEFIIRNIWRLKGGWWDFEIYTLKPPSSKELSEEVSNLFESITAQIDHINKLISEGKYKTALFFVEMAYKTHPYDKNVLKIKSEILELMIETENALMVRNIYANAKGICDDALDNN